MSYYHTLARRILREERIHPALDPIYYEIMLEMAAEWLAAVDSIPQTTELDKR